MMLLLVTPRLRTARETSNAPGPRLPWGHRESMLPGSGNLRFTKSTDDAPCHGQPGKARL